MRKGHPIHCSETAWHRTTDDHLGLILRVASPSLVHVAGVLDLATRDLLVAVLGDVSQADVHLDVGDLEFADAAGLAALAAADAQRRSLGEGRIVVHRASPLLQRTLQLVGLDRMLPHRPHARDRANWRASAACRDAPAELFFDSNDPSPAQRICWSCPVSGSCLTYALQTSQMYGIWGGLSARERALLQRGHLAEGVGKRT